MLTYITIAVLAIAVIVMGLTILMFKEKIDIQKDKIDYHKSIADIYKDSSEKYYEYGMECIEQHRETEVLYEYEHHKVMEMVKALKYADHFLPPRKRKEMWHRINLMPLAEFKEKFYDEVKTHKDN